MEPIYLNYITADNKYNFKIRILKDTHFEYFIKLRLKYLGTKKPYKIWSRRCTDEIGYIVRQIWVYENNLYIEKEIGKMIYIILNDYPDLVHEIFMTYLKYN